MRFLNKKIKFKIIFFFFKEIYLERKKQFLLKMFMKKSIFLLSSLFGSVTLSYLFYVKHCYKYLKSIGFDGPPPKFFIGNLADFASKKNSISDESEEKKPVISHYSKTLRRWTKKYGKIYGYYEGHVPVIVLADPELVSEVFRKLKFIIENVKLNVFN